MIVSALCGLLAAAAPHEVTGRVFPCGVSESFVVNEREPVHWLEYRVPGGIGHRVRFWWTFCAISNADTDRPEPQKWLYWFDEDRLSCVVNHLRDKEPFRLFLRCHGPVPADWKTRSLSYAGRTWPDEIVSEAWFFDEMMEIPGIVGCERNHGGSKRLAVTIAAERLDHGTACLQAIGLACRSGFAVERFDTRFGYPWMAEGYSTPSASASRAGR